MDNRVGATYNTLRITTETPINEEDKAIWEILKAVAVLKYGSSMDGRSSLPLRSALLFLGQVLGPVESGSDMFPWCLLVSKKVGKFF